MAERIQRKRTKGWRMPEGAVYVGRPTRWGNPYRIGEEGSDGQPRTREDTILLFRLSVVGTRLASPWWGPEFASLARAELAGRDLACWCPLDQPCHADVLLEVANRG